MDGTFVVGSGACGERGSIEGASIGGVGSGSGLAQGGRAGPMNSDKPSSLSNGAGSYLGEKASSVVLLIN